MVTNGKTKDNDGKYGKWVKIRYTVHYFNGNLKICNESYKFIYFTDMKNKCEIIENHLSEIFQYFKNVEKIKIQEVDLEIHEKTLYRA